METQENLQPETQEQETTAKVMDPEAEMSAKYYQMSREELLEEARKLLSHTPIVQVREQMDLLKQLFYKKNQAPTETVEKPEEGEEVVTEPDTVEIAFKEVLNTYKSKKGAEIAAEEARREDNLKKKRAILTQLDALIKSSDDLSETIPAFRKLQAEWKEIDMIPQTHVNEIWKEYNHYLEQFYDLVKINNDLREYDFKKNLELKSALCEAAEALEQEEDVVKAFQMLQKLHEEWRETGPVSREERENIWLRFKNASTVINKKHQGYFESIKAQEEELLQEREAICETIEKFDFSTLKTYKQWDDKAKEIAALNDKFSWDNPLSRRVNSKIYKRFRAACNHFYDERATFFKSAKDEMNANLQRKKELCEQAEALKDSKEWKQTSDKLIALQKEWKNIGTISRKHSEQLWKRFVTACDYFFDQKEINFSGKKNQENDNLVQKMAIIEEMKAYKSCGNEVDDINALKALTEKYNAIGHVPFKEKDKLYRHYKEVTDKTFGEIKGRQRMQNIQSSTSRNRLMKQYDQLRAEIATYENNIGFFGNSKKASAIVDDMQRKIDRLKEELNVIVSKIKEMDKND